MFCERYWPPFVPIKDSESDHIIDNWHRGRMFGAGDFNLNRPQRCSNSVKEAMKQAMLNHEAIFRKQLCELHRLYKLQRRLMQDLSWKQFSECLERPEAIDLSAEKSMDVFPMACLLKVNSTCTENRDMFIECDGSASKFHKPSTLDLRLPADEYIVNLGVETGSDCSKVKNFLVENNDKHLGSMKVAVGARNDLFKMGDAHRTMYNQVIDLDESLERMSDEEAKPISSIDFEAPNTSTGPKYGVRQPDTSNPIISGGIGGWNEQKPFDLNDEWKEGSASPCTHLPTHRQPSISFEGTAIDLNRSQLDVSSSICQYPSLIFNSPEASSSGVSCQPAGCSSAQGSTLSTKLPDNIWTCKGSVMDPIDLESGAYENSLGGSSSRSNCDMEIGPQPHGCSSLSHAGSFKLMGENVGFSVEPQKGFQQCYNSQNYNSTAKPMSKMENHVNSPLGGTELFDKETLAGLGISNREESEDDDESSSQLRSHVLGANVGATVDQVGGYYAEHLTSNKPTTDDSLCLVKGSEAAKEEEFVLGQSNFAAGSEPNQLESQVTETLACSRDLNSGTYVDSDLQKASCNLSKEDLQDQNEWRQDEAVEREISFQRAAESLVHMSLEKSANSPVWFANAGPLESASEEKSSSPQYPSDSYESIILKLTETNIEEYSSPAKPVEEKGAWVSPCGLKMKRGRRTRDFRRDVLPGLGSLSRHEICEDMHTISGAIRSNKSKRNGSQRIKWDLTTRSRRSRVY